MKSEDPNDPDDHVTGQQNEQKDPVGIEELFTEPQGSEAADDGQDGALEDESGVGVDDAGLVRTDCRGGQELSPRVREESGRHRGEDDHAGHQHQIGRVDPQPVVAHGLQG